MMDYLDDLVTADGDLSGVTESARIYPLVADSGNRRVLREWIVDHDSHRLVETDQPILEAEFDLCIVDREGLLNNREPLQRAKSAAEPVLMPVLLLLPETRTGVIEVDDGQIADNVFATTIDEIVSLPIRQTELEWRIRALLRLRAQSLNLERRTETLELFRQAVDEAGYAVYITDPDGTIKYVNPAFEEITGYSSEEALGQTPQMLNSGEMPEEYFEELWETILAGEVWHGDVVDRRQNGVRYYASQTIAPITDDGDITAFVAIQTDITDRKARKQILEQRTEAIEKAPVGITIADAEHRDNPLTYVNEAFESLTGYDREVVIGNNWRFLHGEETDPERIQRLQAAIEDNEPLSLDIRCARKDGTIFWNQLTVAPVRDEDGTAVSYVGFHQDVTDRKEREQQLQILGRVLRHNIRNEMNVIQGWAETIQSQADEPLPGADRIIAESEQLNELAEKEKAITDLLTEPSERVETDLGELLAHVEQTVTETHPGATVAIDCPTAVTVSVSVHFEDAVEELVGNAVVHNDGERPEVTITVYEEEDWVRLRVRDSGPEIPEMERAVLLGNADQTSTYHGSGLGLWLVNLIVSRSGGCLRYETAEPQGNLIEIMLPYE